MKIKGFKFKIHYFKTYSDFFGQTRGIALVMVLWVMVILFVIVLEFSFGMRTEVNITQNYKEEVLLYSMAQGGVQRAVAELIYKHDPKIQLMRRNLILEEIPSGKKEWVTDGRSYLFPYEQGTCEIRIISEAGKININLVSESILRKIITLLGLDGEMRDVVVDSILDWRDPDDFYRVNGAENSYYQSLKEPYDCKNGNLDSIEELLLIKGISQDLFYGRKSSEEEKKGIQVGLKDIFSIYAPGAQIDINSASSTILGLVLGIPEDIIQRVIKAREEKPFVHQQDLLQRIPELKPFINEDPERQALILYGRSLMTPYYSIESRAKLKKGKAIRGLKVIIKVDPREKEGYKIIQWIDRT